MKELIGIVGTGFLIAGFAPYLLGLWRKTAKPHAFSWLSWGLTNAIVFAVQFTENAGPGAWTAGVATLFNFGIAAYALRHGEKNITRGDWIILATVLAALPLWVLTEDPVWAVILLSIIDTLAFIPTIRKAWYKPHEEVATTFAMGGIGFVCALAALETYSFTNICFPVKVILTNGLFVTLILYRRRATSLPRAGGT